MEPYGDELERARLSQPRSPSAELIWQQLPPLTAGTDAFVLAGILEPSYDVGGDAFDYALSEHTVSLGIFDAVGHGLPAGLLAAAALAGYRSARRDGRGVYDQARRSTTWSRPSFPAVTSSPASWPSSRCRPGGCATSMPDIPRRCCSATAGW